MAKPIIELRNIEKKYGAVTVVDNIDLTIYENEFVTLLGPSGCGKTTTLRMIGGFEYPDSGEIVVNGKIINELPAYARPINTVFQRYALFPHLNVFNNVAFGIKNRGRKFMINFYGGIDHIKEEIKKDKLALGLPLEKASKVGYFDVRKKLNEYVAESVKNALKMVNLSGFEERKIQFMSGGQMQRVAIARAIVLKPKILLLDEPLSALDLKLRQNMQYELKEMQRKLGITFIFVTHDQEEALTMSDTIVVMNDGYIQQIGTPEDIYNEPRNRFVANFIGESNIIRGQYVGPKKVKFMGQEFDCVDENFKVGEECDVVIRPEDFDRVPLDVAKLVGVVESVVFKGVHFEICAIINGMEFVIHDYEVAKVGDQIGLSVDPYEIHLMKVEQDS